MPSRGSGRQSCGEKLPLSNKFARRLSSEAGAAVSGNSSHAASTSTNSALPHSPTKGAASAS
ncbi:MAG: hypothetical protein NDI91_00750 [Sulfuritalea sp.]|nr:hypothetical protein [Sulfuritalea sp.]